tara:strand:- start:1520 stop:1825 length:306 start_codon:yes stop_codon:yes gene_type:complete
MTEDDKKAMADMIGEFVDLYCDLVRVNRRIGIWDMRRHDVCKARDEDIDVSYLAKTERLGRISVEKRARIKTRIDELFAELVAYRARFNNSNATPEEARVS